MRMHALIVGIAVVVGAALVVGADAQDEGAPSPTAAIGRVLDELHAAASAADGRRYFPLFTDGAVFLGTDATERWPIDEFRAYATARFEQGTGWTYRMTERHVVLGPGGRTAWFDELLHNEKYGTCRGSGVLVSAGGTWKIAQYNLSIPIPNELALEVVAKIRKLKAEG